ncbi:MAG: hypothetical protein KDA60_11935 [Planctomycetales bacterium]|nr:hypothetical protein [Planctomycetales bacterium]
MNRSQGELAPQSCGPFQFSLEWPDPTPETRAAVEEFWATEKAIEDSAQRELRSRQLLIVARDVRRRVAGVSTVVAQHVDQLGFPCFYYRTYIAQSHRNIAMLAKDMFLASYDALNRRFQAGYDPVVLGLFLELQNASLARHLNYAVWKMDGMNAVYIGKNKHGLPCRVWYFDGARVP